MASTKGEWVGLVTNSSPYALPPGASTVQVNITNCIPGQLTSRGGMRKVAFKQHIATILDACPYDAAGEQGLIAMRGDGAIVALNMPAYGEEPQPEEPLLAVADGEVTTSYTMRYLDGSYGAVEDQPPAPPPDTVTNTLDGNPVSVYYVDAMEQCDEDLPYEVFDGGNAGTDEVPETVILERLCDL